MEIMKFTNLDVHGCQKMKIVNILGILTIVKMQ
jgi:hypothetical protein